MLPYAGSQQSSPIESLLPSRREEETSSHIIHNHMEYGDSIDFSNNIILLSEQQRNE